MKVQQRTRKLTSDVAGLVAVGSVPVSSGVIAAVWTSRDGRNWSRVPQTRKVFGVGSAYEGGVEASSVTAGGPGLVAVGGPESAVFVWISVDGITWSRLPPAADFIGAGDQSMRSVIVGFMDETIAVVWTSRDGITWSRVPHSEAVFGGGGEPEMVDVVAKGSNLIAVGSDCTEMEVYVYDNGYQETDCVDRNAVVWKTNN